MYGSIFNSKKTSEMVTLIAIFIILSLLLPLLSINYLAYSVVDTKNVLNPNAMRFHNVSCSQISHDVDRSNGASNAILEVNNNVSYKLNISWLIISSDDGQDFYKGDCNNPTNIVLKGDESIKLRFNNNIGEGVGVFLANNSKSDKSILLEPRGQEFKQISVDNNITSGGVGTTKAFEFNVLAEKQGMHKLIITEVQNSETLRFIIIKNVRVL